MARNQGQGTDGEFYCARCGGDRNYRARTGRLPGRRGLRVVCTDCRARYGPEVLEAPTCRGFVLLIRDAARALALAALAADGSCDAASREAACAAVRSAGSPECQPGNLLDEMVELQQVDDPDATRVDGLPPTAAARLRAALVPLGPHLAEPGRAHLLATAARVALADGAYTPNERAMLMAAGHALTMPDAQIRQVLREAAAAGR
ncbi:hypothetical protein BIV57_09860 [Mangrovactinospora gilvigrisea]|uniref:Co-chaperone DjlA N-terminal domain-containing protein n=1 Tax=Mangrovactinospora gilvigrisea TaxID=1428644 RepID=A0A1J7CDD0_9ACTN|nr:TerB family tellurite resistance protein [Mangrovactinospora gilvigrisea]OIV37666.1 hypothetical protein BIV57_09860 [Mangrovactinospora gilvigrisea]